MMETATISNETLAARYTEIRNRTVSLTRPLQTEDFSVQPIVDVSPPKWHLAHSTWFFETFILKGFDAEYQEFDPQYNYLFNSYYESVGERTLRADRGNLTRPSVDEVLAYRKYVDEALKNWLKKTELTEESQSLMELGLQHEQQHQELLVTDIKYILGHNPVFPVYKSDSETKPLTEVQSLQFSEIEEGLYPIGHNMEGFCFDNEKGEHQVFLHCFEIADRLVTNGEYIEFMEAGGYQQFKWWLADAWEWVNANNVNAPEYWHKIDGKWFHYTLAGLMPVDRNTPVSHVSYYEADAYAAWKGLRLPTEFEWEVACKTLQAGIPVGANFSDEEKLQPAVDPDNNGFYGNCWEWTSSAYLPYPYFIKAAGAVGEYNGKFMINQMVLRGGSCATPRDHIRATYRNFFQTDKRWQFTGIRLAKSI